MIRVYFPHVIFCKQNRCKAARSAWHSVISLEASHVIDTVALSGSSKGVWLPCCSVWKQCLTLCDLMNYSTPGFPVLHYLSEFAQTHVHWVDDAIQPSHPLLPPLPPGEKALSQPKYLGENNRMGKTRGLFRKISDTKGALHAKMSAIKTVWTWNRNRRF